MKPTLVEPQSPSGYGKVPFATSGPPNLTNTGDNHKNNYKNIILEILAVLFKTNSIVFKEVKKSLNILLICCPKYPAKIKTRQQVRELFLLQGDKLTLYKPPFYLFQDTDTSAGRAEGPRASSDEVHQDNEVAEEAQQLQLLPGTPISPRLSTHP